MSAGCTHLIEGGVVHLGEGRFSAPLRPEERRDGAADPRAHMLGGIAVAGCRVAVSHRRRVPVFAGIGVAAAAPDVGEKPERCVYVQVSSKLETERNLFLPKYSTEYLTEYSAETE